jgi:hypothetical protein
LFYIYLWRKKLTNFRFISCKRIKI